MDGVETEGGKVGEARKQSTTAGNLQDWRDVFTNEKSMGSLRYIEPLKLNEKIVVKPPEHAVEEGMEIWKPSPVGQLLDKLIFIFIFPMNKIFH